MCSACSLSHAGTESQNVAPEPTVWAIQSLKPECVYYVTLLHAQHITAEHCSCAILQALLMLLRPRSDRRLDTHLWSLSYEGAGQQRAPPLHPAHARPLCHALHLGLGQRAGPSQAPSQQSHVSAA